MIANYHTHTYRCRHAEADEEAYVRAAVAAGIKTLGFTDHAPMPFDGGYYSSFRMTPEETPGYVATVASLAGKYENDVKILTGFEVEYYPKLFSRFLAFIAPFDVDYLILGQHFLRNETDGPYAAVATDDAGVLSLYVDQCAGALSHGVFSCFAHPDLIRYTGDTATYRREARRLCREAKGCGVPLEINLLGLATGRHYPNPIFWEEAAAVGNTVILGRDAHAASAFADSATEERARKMASDLGIELIERLELIKPKP